MRKPETALVDRIRKQLTARGAWVLKVHGSAMQVSGIPDLIVCYRGCMLGLEVKTPENTKGATSLQKLTLQEMTDAGAFTAVVTGWHEVLPILETIDDRNSSNVLVPDQR